MAEDSDEALLSATAAGDMSAFERLHKRYHSRVFGFVSKIVGRPDVAEEVVTDTLMVVWRKADSFRGQSRPSTWIFGIAYRTAIKARRKGMKHAFHDEIDDTIPAERTGTQEIEAIFLRKNILAALEQLSPEHRAVVELTYYHGLKVTEIAEIIDCPVGTVKTRMFHARAKLRDLLRDEALSIGDQQ